MPAINYCLLSFLLFSLLHTSGFAQGPTYSAAIEQKIKAVESNLGEAIKTDDAPILLAERMKLNGVPGLSIAVIKDYKIEWARGYGFSDKEQKKPVTTVTLFQAASISKSVNAAGVLRLVQDKKLHLDSNINHYLKSWQFPYDTSKGKKIITLRHLLSHTAGTSVHGFRGYAAGENVPTVVQILNGEAPANNAPIRSVFDAGSKVEYSGGGTTITQLMVSDVSGQPYDVYLKKSVLDPLGMKESFFTVPPPPGKQGNLAIGYDGAGNAIKGNYHLHPEQAAAALWTNPSELARFIIELQLAAAGKSNKVLNKETASLMLTPVQWEAALGVWIKTVGDEQYFGHGGSNVGFRCSYFGSKNKGTGVIVMVNSDNGTILNEVINSVATVYGWKDFYKPVVRKTINLPVDTLDAYTGEYELTPQFKIQVRRKENTLLIQATNQPEVRLYAEEANKFFVKEVEASIEFVKNEAGKTTKLVLHQNGMAMDGVKIK